MAGMMDGPDWPPPFAKVLPVRVKWLARQGMALEDATRLAVAELDEAVALELTVPRRTPWGTYTLSAPDAPPIEEFGPTDETQPPKNRENYPRNYARGLHSHPRDVRLGDRWLPFHDRERGGP